jgi:hypothetical protein
MPILSLILFNITSERNTLITVFNQYKSLLILLFTVFFSGIIYSQSDKSPVNYTFTFFGLDNKTVTSLTMEYPELYTFQQTENLPLLAGTAGDGVYIIYPFKDTSNWSTYGLQGKFISALTVQHWGAGPADGLKAFAGVDNRNSESDTILLFQREVLLGWDTIWTPSDGGLNRESFHKINALSSYYYTGQTPPQPVLLATDSALYYGPGYWSHAIYQGPIKVNAIDVNPHWYGDLACAAGRVSLSATVFISKDKGINWDKKVLPTLVESEVYSVAINQQHPDTIYAGGDGYGTIWITTDGGDTWNSSSLASLNTKITALAVDPIWSNLVYAGGIQDDSSFTFFFSNNAGYSWQEVAPFFNLAGVSSIAVSHTGTGTDSSRAYAFIGTLGAGVWKFSTDNVTSVKNPNIHPETFQLYQNYPNPFNSITKIKYRIAEREFVSFKIYDILGNEVATFVNEIKSTGIYDVEFDASKLTSGVYFYRLHAGDFFETKKMILLR